MPENLIPIEKKHEVVAEVFKVSENQFGIHSDTINPEALAMILCQLAASLIGQELNARSKIIVPGFIPPKNILPGNGQKKE